MKILSLVFCAAILSVNAMAIVEPEGKFTLNCKGTTYDRLKKKEMPILLVAEGEGPIETYFPATKIQFSYDTESFTPVGPDENLGYSAVGLQDEQGGFYVVGYYEWKTKLNVKVGGAVTSKDFENHLELVGKPKTIRIDGPVFSNHTVYFDARLNYQLSYQRNKDESATFLTATREYDEVKCVMSVVEL